MRFVYRMLIAWLLTSGLVLASAAGPAPDARTWLMKMNEAPQRFDYDGVFVHHSGMQLETMRIVHKVEKGMVRERLVSLNGAPREIVRNEHEVLCYLPDEKSVVVEHRKTDARAFPSILPQRLPELETLYVIELGKSERMAGRVAQQFGVRPRDGYRYGYRLWADIETGLLLRADLLDNKGQTLEQFMFTQLAIGPVQASALQPEMSTKGMAWYRESAAPAPTAPVRPWNAGSLPKGFALSHRVSRYVPMRNKNVAHLVYTDGLASVSVFVEPLDAGAKPPREGATRMGAVHAYVRRADERHVVTAVGEVPADTVAQIAKSVTQAH